jgi:hypothetical protein
LLPARGVHSRGAKRTAQTSRPTATSSRVAPPSCPPVVLDASLGSVAPCFGDRLKAPARALPRPHFPDPCLQPMIRPRSTRSPVTSLRSASIAGSPARRAQGAVARIIPLYTLYVRPQKTRIQAQDELRGTVMMRIVTARLSPLEDRRGARRNEMTACDDRFEQRTDLPTRSRGST